MSFSLKKKQILIPVTEWMNSEDIILHKIYQLQKEILYESTDIRYLEKRQTIEWWLPGWRGVGGGGLEYYLMNTEFQFYSNGVLEVNCNDVAHLILPYP